MNRILKKVVILLVSLGLTVLVFLGSVVVVGYLLAWYAGDSSVVVYTSQGEFWYFELAIIIATFIVAYLKLSARYLPLVAIPEERK